MTHRPQPPRRKSSEPPPSSPTSRNQDNRFNNGLNDGLKDELGNEREDNLGEDLDDNLDDLDDFDDLIEAPNEQLRSPETWNDNWRDRDRVPRAPLWRRGYAMSLDFLIASLVCALLTNNNWFGQLVTFNFAWLAIRAVVPASNFGQSPGRWAFDIRTVDQRYERTPGVYELLRREAIAGNAAFLAYTGWRALGSLNAFYLLFLIPLAVDVGFAWLEPGKPFAFHDRIGQTVVVVTRRGYSLDLKVKKWLAIALANMKR